MTESARQLFWVNEEIPFPVHWFDGILNAGESHTSSSNVWKNIGSAGSSYDATRNKNSSSTTSLWGDNYALFNSRTSVYTPFFVAGGDYTAFTMLGTSYTIGATFAVAAGWRQNYSGCLGTHMHWNNGTHVGLNFIQYENGYASIHILYKEANDDFTGHKFDISLFQNDAVNNVLFSVSPERRTITLNGNVAMNDETYRDAAKIRLNSNVFAIGNSYIDTSSYSTDRSFVGKIFDVYAWDTAMDEKTMNRVAKQSLSRFGA